MHACRAENQVDSPQRPPAADTRTAGGPKTDRTLRAAAVCWGASRLGSQTDGLMCWDTGTAQVEWVNVYPKEFVAGSALLNCELSETNGTLAGNLAYNKDVFSQASAERIASQLQAWAPLPACRQTALLQT